MEATSIIQDDQILDSEILVEEVEVALRLLKLGRSKGADGLSAEHLIYGGTAIVLWLKKILNRIISLEEVPSCLKEGVIIPVYKGKGKDPMVTHSYRGITLSSVIAKTFEIVILNRMSPVLDRLGFPDINQTAFQKGISCADAIFSTQEVLLHYIRQGESPFLCFYDIEKAFDSIEFPVLLSHLQSIGISGKSWRLIKSWYDSPTSRVKLHNRVSDPFLITRGVKQGSVLSPSLFLVVMNTLIQKLRSISCGASLQGIYTGTAIHADDVRCIAPNVQSLLTQSSEIQSFTDEVGLKLNFSKLEVIRISQIPSKESTQVKIGQDVIAPSRSARCLGVQWQHNLSASESVKVNISKARKAFFSLGSTGVFHGKLNPLSASSIFETCIIPILLYGCETWLLDSTCLQDLEKFRRILGLSKFHSKTAVRVALHWPSMSTRTLLRKLSFLGKLICNNADTMSFPEYLLQSVWTIYILFQLCSNVGC